MLKEKFLEFGYTEEEYYAIRNSYALSNYLDDILLKKYCDAILFFLKLGYIKEEVINMTKTFPQIYGLSIENIKQKINDMVSLGYIKEEVIKMTKTFPHIYSYSIENMMQKINDMVSLGYTKEEVIKITKTFPTIYSLSIKKMKQKINDMVSLGYTKEDVIKITKTFPTIYGLSIENMKQKIDFYDSINMHELAVVDSKYLMQSVSLSYARYMFYLSIGEEIDMTNYRKLFIGNKRFEKTYGVTKKEILDKYNYDEYLKEKENGRTI